MALQIIRQAVAAGSGTQTELHLVLLDWAQAVDKVSQDGLFLALERMRTPDKRIDAIKQMHRNPTFFVEIDGERSDYFKQEAGIRQACPMSPYLFLILMTVLFHDIHKGDKLKLRGDRLEGFDFDEALFADDTILFSKNSTKLEKLLQKIEKEGAKYGLELNKDKCEHLNFNSTADVRFKNKMKVKKKEEAK